MCKSADPSQSQTNQAMGYSRKNVSREVKRGQTFLEKSLEFLGLSLYSGKFRRKQSFTFENSTKFCYIPSKCKCHPKTKTHGNFNSFLFDPWNFHMLFLHTIPLEIPCPKPCYLDFLWNSPITELCVVLLFSQKYY